MRKWVSSFAKKHEPMNHSYDITTSEGKSQFIESYREAVKSEAELSLKAFCDRMGLSDGYTKVFSCQETRAPRRF